MPATRPTPSSRRQVRRRRRAPALDSDDDIQREPRSDDDDNDDNDHDDSDDDDSEPDVVHLPTPRNSKSPESILPSADWSEIVAHENANGPTDLPVIDFADFSSRPRKTKKPHKSKRPPPESATTDTPIQPSASPPPSQPRPRQVLPGHSARQLYQQKIDSDPSFVPTIGNFWGHDDRLIDTEFRSLSGWWRGRRGRGRGRGGFGMRGRGGHSFGPNTGTEHQLPQEELPPVERTWTHDGFEEMKKKEETRRVEQRQDQLPSKRGGFVGSGRGAFVPNRGRGGFSRGGFVPATLQGRGSSPFGAASRLRFAIKPELMWTKQHEAFLYFDSSLKPRLGQGPGLRIRLPGQQQTQVVRAPPIPRTQPEASTSKVTADSSTADYFVVRIPKRAGKEKALPLNTKSVESIVEVDSVSQPLVSPTQPVSSTNEPSVVVSELEKLTVEPVPDPERQAKTEQAVLRQHSDDVARDDQASAVPLVQERPSLPPLQTTFTPPPPPPPPQPIPQPSSGYGSPYGYPIPLPPGVALNSHGLPYEVATGRPVYLQPPPQMYTPRPMMPSHPGMPFMPGHIHHPSTVSIPAVSPDFLAQQTPSHTPPLNGFIDPATGTPIFSFPRQTSRIEIRAPNGPTPGQEVSTNGTKTSAPKTPSGLRTTATSFQPSRTASISIPASETLYYQQPLDAVGSYDTRHPPMDEHSASQGIQMNGMVHYHHQGSYTQPYYYPEHYGYQPYVDMSHGGQYDMYGADQAVQGPVYY